MFSEYFNPAHNIKFQVFPFLHYIHEYYISLKNVTRVVEVCRCLTRPYILIRVIIGEHYALTKYT